MRRDLRARKVAIGSLAAAVVTSVSLSGGGSTYSALSDFHTSSARVGAGIWAPDPPAECDEILVLPQASIVWGTPGDDVLQGDNHPQVLMGLGGNDVIHAGNQSDCLVGGDGDDRLYGTNAKDVLLGGPGNDHLDGGNAKDHLDGGPDFDTCLGGNGHDTIVNCEAAQGPTQRFTAPLEALAPGPQEESVPAPSAPATVGEPGTTPEQAAAEPTPTDVPTPTP